MSAEKRVYPRILGPFDGTRVGVIDFPIQVHDISVGGCFVNYFAHPPEPGRRFTLRIDLPEQGPIEVRVESLYGRSKFGYAVRFVEISEEARIKLLRAFETLADERRAYEDA
jgi:hypothetical protein